MADPRTFTLIGEFKDGITPELERINRTLNSLKTSFSNLGGKGARNSSRDVGRLAVSIRTLNDTLKDSNVALRAAIAPMREYRREIGKTVGAYKKLNEAGANAKGLQDTNRALREQLRLLEQVRRNSGSMSAAQRGLYRRPGISAPVRSLGGGGGGGITRPPAGGGGGYAAYAGSTAGGVLGIQLASGIQSAIVSGFRIGTDMMAKPFQYWGGRFGERVKDELDDLNAAGGFFAVSRRSKNPFLKSMDDAIDFQQDLNASFAKMAAALPGVTNDYVQVGKRIGDTFARVVANDFPAALEKANKIRMTEEGKKFFGGQITGTGPEAQKEVLKTLIGDMTKTTVLAGMGGASGHGGMRGAYGLPALTERMVSQDTVSMGQFQRYAAVFSNPMIADAMQRHIKNINATAKDTIARSDALDAMYKEIITPEFIEKLRTSFDGVYRSLESAINDPDVGLFGLSRQFKGLGKKIDSYGRYVDEEGKVVDDIKDAADATLGLFEVLRDVFVNTGQALGPIIENIQLVWDPMRTITEALADARHYTAEFARTFNEYRVGIDNFVAGLDDATKAKFAGTVDFRASLAAINNMLNQFGAYGKNGEKDFKEIGDLLLSPDADLGAILKEMVETLMSSEVAENIGKSIGTVIGTVLSETGNALKFLGDFTSAGGFAGGLAKGFKDAGGFEGIQNIFVGLIKLLFKAITTAITEMPLLSAIVAGLAMLPTLISMAITGAIQLAMSKVTGGALSSGLLGGMGGGRGGIGGGGGTPGAGGGGIATALRNAFVPAAYRQRGKSQQYTAPIGPAPAPRRDISTGQLTSGPSYLPSSAQPGIKTRQPPRALIRQRNMFGDMARRFGKTSLGRVMLEDADTIGKGAKAAGQGIMGFGKGAVNLGKGAMGAAKGIGKFIPGGALVMGGIDAAVRMGAGQDAGKAIGGAAATAIGSTLGGILGQALIPIPGVGAALGGVAGGILGDKLFNYLTPETEKQRQAADKQLLAAQLQQQAARADDARRTGKDMGAITPLTEDPAKLKAVLQMQGLAGDPLGDKLLAQSQAVNKTNIALDQFEADLNRIHKSYKDLGYTPEQIVGQNDYRAAQDKVKQFSATLKEQQTELEKTFKAMPQAASKGIVTAMQKLDIASINAIIAAKFTGLEVPQIDFKMTGLSQNVQVPPNFWEMPAKPGAKPPVNNPFANLNPSAIAPISAPRNPLTGSYYKGGLGDAIATEMKHKPPGSDLVVANSSETIIPASNGLGMKDFLSTLRLGFARVASLAQPATLNPGLSSGGMNNGNYGGEVNVTNNINITQAEGQNADQLAYVVVEKITAAMRKADAASLFV